MPEKRPLSVKQLNTYIKSLLESDFHLADVTVCGEISNFKNHYLSGHLYFTLKDSDCAIRCVMFKSNAARLAFTPEDGMQAVIRGRVSVYEKDGQYMLYASEIHAAGLGDLSLRFEQVKQKLKAEGMFEESSKRPLPEYPEKIAVITSDSGAAVKDITNILGIRYPLCEIVMCPVTVQGELSAQSIIGALERVYSLPDIDVIIVGRGGGSAEDLNAFNDEMLARKVFESPVPVISAVGHETDFTIHDFVADVRASTPSHAAELAVPDINELKFKTDGFTARLYNVLKRKYGFENERFKRFEALFTDKSINDFLELKMQTLDGLGDRMTRAAEGVLKKDENRLFNAMEKIDALSPFKVIQRGFSYVKKGEETVKSVNALKKGDGITVGFCDGKAVCTVLKTESEENIYGR